MLTVNVIKIQIKVSLRNDCYLTNKLASSLITNFKFTSGFRYTCFISFLKATVFFFFNCKPFFVSLKFYRHKRIMLRFQWFLNLNLIKVALKFIFTRRPFAFITNNYAPKKMIFKLIFWIVFWHKNQLQLKGKRPVVGNFLFYLYNWIIVYAEFKKENIQNRWYI